MANRYNHKAKFHKIELDNIYVLIKRGCFNKAKMYLDEYRDCFGEEHPIYKKVYAILNGYLNDDLDKVIKLHEELLIEGNLANRDEICLNLAYLYIKNNDYLSAYKLLIRTDVSLFDLEHIECLNRFCTLFDFVSRHMDLYKEGYNIHYGRYDDNYSMKKIIMCNIPNIAYDYIIDKDIEELRDLYYYIVSILKNSKKTFDYSFGDKYFFRIKNIGISVDGKKHSDILRVITFPNTNKIITMYPVGSRLKDNTIINEFSNDLEEKEYIRVRANQVDKFNSKWGY